MPIQTITAMLSDGHHDVAVDTAAVAAGIAATNAIARKAVADQDTQVIGDIYTTDAILLPPDADIIRGREAVRAYWTAGFGIGLKGFEPVTLELDVIDDETAVELGAATITLAGDSDDTTTFAKFTVLWKKVDSDWKLHWDQFVYYDKLIE